MDKNLKRVIGYVKPKSSAADKKTTIKQGKLDNNAPQKDKSKAYLKDIDFHDIIVKAGISISSISIKIGMSRGTFANKLRSTTEVYNFTPEEKEKLREVLLKVSKEIEHGVK